MKARTDRVLGNVPAVLAAAGSSLDEAVKATVTLANAGDLAAVNEVYAKLLPTAPGDALGSLRGPESDARFLAWARQLAHLQRPGVIPDLLT